MALSNRPDILAAQLPGHLLGPARLEGHLRHVRPTPRGNGITPTAWDHDNVWTPQVVVNGRVDVVGVKHGEIEGAIAQGRPR